MNARWTLAWLLLAVVLVSLAVVVATLIIESSRARGQSCCVQTTSTAWLNCMPVEAVE